MTMKKIIAFCLLMMVCVCQVYAQTDSQRKAQRQQLSKAQANHIAEELDLNGKKRALFIQTYCNCQKEIWALGPKSTAGKDKNETETDARESIRNSFDHSKRILAIREKYYEKYSKFLSQKEIEQVYELERQAMRRLSQRNPNVQRRR